MDLINSLHESLIYQQFCLDVGLNKIPEVTSTPAPKVNVLRGKNPGSKVSFVAQANIC